LRQENDGSWQTEMIFDSDLNIASFGEDETGELYILDLDGTVHRLLSTSNL
jgi:hypothetical protein